MAGHYINTIEDKTTGRPVNGATVLVYVDGATIVGDNVASGTLATIFSDDGVTTINQTGAPITTGSDGEFDFYTNETRVVIAVLYNGNGVAVWNDIDIVGGSIDSDVSTLAVRVDTAEADILALEARVDAVETVTQDPLIVDLAALTDPGADRILFWDDSAGDLAWLEAGSGLAISGTGISVSGFASTTQTAEQISGFIATPADKDYRIAVKMAHGGTITETTTRSASGTATATFKVNTTALGGTANSVSSAEQSQAHSGTNTFAAGDDIVLTISSNATCADISFTIVYTRTLA